MTWGRRGSSPLSEWGSAHQCGCGGSRSIVFLGYGRFAASPSASRAVLEAATRCRTSDSEIAHHAQEYVRIPFEPNSRSTAAGSITVCDRAAVICPSPP